jgi:hypothetical protein
MNVRNEYVHILRTEMVPTCAEACARGPSSQVPRKRKTFLQLKLRDSLYGPSPPIRSSLKVACAALCSKALTITNVFICRTNFNMCFHNDKVLPQVNRLRLCFKILALYYE